MDVAGDVLVAGTRHTNRHISLNDHVGARLVAVEARSPIAGAVRNDIPHDIPANHAVAHIAVNRRAIMQHLHDMGDVVLLDEVAAPAENQSTVGRVGDFVPREAQPLLSQRGQTGGREGQPRPEQSIGDDLGILHIDAQSTGPTIRHGALRKAQPSGLTRLHARAPDMPDHQPLKRAILRTSDLQSPWDIRTSEARIHTGRRRTREHQSLQPQISNRILPPAFYPYQGLDLWSDNPHPGHILTWSWPVDDLPLHTVQVPLSRFGHPLPNAEDLVLASAKRPRRRHHLPGEAKDALFHIVRDDMDEGLAPHVVEADIRITGFETCRQISLAVGHRRQFLLRRLPPPPAINRRSKLFRPPPEVLELIGHGRITGTWRHDAIHQQRAEVPLVLLHSWQVGGEESITLLPPPRYGDTSPEHRFAVMFRADGQIGVRRSKFYDTFQKVVAIGKHDLPGRRRRCPHLGKGRLQRHSLGRHMHGARTTPCHRHQG